MCPQPVFHLRHHVNHEHELVDCTVFLIWYPQDPRKTDHCSNVIFVASHPKMGANFWSWRREAVLVYVVSMLLSNAMYHCITTSAASKISKREITGNREMFTVSPKPS